MKFPFLVSLGARGRAGTRSGRWRASRTATHRHAAGRGRAPGARSPLAGALVHAPLAFHWARMIELLHAAEVIEGLLHDPALLGDELTASGPRALGRGHHRGAARHAHPPLRGRRRRPRHDVQPHRLHDAQQPGDERGHPRGRARAPRRPRAHRGPAQPHRGGHSRLRPLPLVRHARARGRCRSPWRSSTRAAPSSSASVATASGARCGPRPRPLLVLAIGNPSRGDDALGPLFASARGELARRRDRRGQVELLTDFQLQIEHALDLVGRARVVFVDASVPRHFVNLEAALAFFVAELRRAPISP
jgi:hypothetical protein